MLLASVFPKIDDADDLNPPALEIAIIFGDKEAINILLHYGADLNIRYNGSLCYIFKADNADCLQQLGRYGLQVTSSQAGTTMLEMAVENRARKCLDYFIGISHISELLDIKNPKSLWRLALSSTFDEMVEQLERLPNFKQSVNNLTADGKNCLHFAMRKQASRENQHKKLKIIEVLIRDGVEINKHDLEGNTPLHLASDVRSAKLLISWGANVVVRNNDGFRPTEESSQWHWSFDTLNWCPWKHRITEAPEEVTDFR